MLKSILLDNFRGFSGPHEVPLGKLTLLYGPNSSGKSSVLQALKLLANTNDANQVNPLVSLPFYRNNFQIGKFESNVNEQNLNKNIGLGFSSTSNTHSTAGILGEFLLQGLKLDCRFFYKFFSTTEFKKIMDEDSNNWLDYYWYNKGTISQNLVQKIELKIYPPGRAQNFGLIVGPADPLISGLDSVTPHPISKTKWGQEISQSINAPYPGKNSAYLAFHLECIDSFLELVKTCLSLTYESTKLELSNPLSVFFSDDEKSKALIKRLKLGLKALDRPELKTILSHTSWRITTDQWSSAEPNHSFHLAFNENDLFSLIQEGDDDFLNILNYIQHLIHDINNRFHGLETTKYIGPIRALPKRYAIINDYPEQKGFYDRGAEFPYSVITQQEKEQVNRWLKTLGIPYTLEIVETGNEFTGPIITPTVKHTQTGIVLTLAEVGFGISQVLPIIGCLSDSTQPTYIEQPELHLHPKMQASLADFFIERISEKFSLFGEKQKGKDIPDPNSETTSFQEITHKSQDNGQWIIETHSEALMLRVQRRIREGLVSHKDISVVYVGNIEGEGSVVVPLRLNEEGEFIDEWPGGFFEEGFDEVFGTEE